MSVIALSASSNAYATNEKKVDMHPAMRNSYANLTPLTVITSRIGSRTAKNTRIDWTEGEEVPHTVVVGIDASTTLTIANWAYLRIYDTLFVPRTKEVVRVTATPSTTSVTVVRGIGDTSEASILPTDIVQIMSPSKEEAADSSESRQVTDTNQYNYTQVINHFIKTSKSTLKEETFFGPKRVENQAKMWREYRIKVEKQLYFGYKSSASGTTYNYRVMGGLVEKLATGTNVYTVPGLLTETGFDNWLDKVYSNMADATSLTLFASPRLISVINRFAKEKIQTSPKTKEYGMNLRRYFGAVDVDLVRCPLLSGDTTLQGWGFLLDMDRVNLAYLRNPMLLKNTYTERAEYVEDKIESELSFILSNEIAHGFIEGVTG